MNSRMSRVWIVLLFLGVTFLNLSRAQARSRPRPRHRRHPPAIVVGTVLCDTCFQQEFSEASHHISGATVAVECADIGSTRSSFYKEVKTNEHGKFSVYLPFSVSKHVKKIEGCSAKLISSSEPYCAVASTTTSSSLHLKSRKRGTHVFSAGFFTFKPLNQPELCNRKPSIQSSSKKAADPKKSPITNPDDPTFLPPIQDPPTSFPPIGQGLLPPLPRLLPPIKLPPLVLPLPGLPTPPAAKDSSRESQSEAVVQPKFFNPIGGIPFPPNPLFPPPSIQPPNPYQPQPSVVPPIFPSTPPSILPPNPYQPQPSVIPPIFPSNPPSILPPIFPSPSTSILPPIFPSPSSSIFPPIFPSPSSSTIPPMLPSPPIIPPLTPGIAPPPPTFQFPLPPFPFQPTPGFPGFPPATISSNSKKKSSSQASP